MPSERRQGVRAPLALVFGLRRGVFPSTGFDTRFPAVCPDRQVVLRLAIFRIRALLYGHTSQVIFLRIDLKGLQSFSTLEGFGKFFGRDSSRSSRQNVRNAFFGDLFRGVALPCTYCCVEVLVKSARIETPQKHRRRWKGRYSSGRRLRGEKSPKTQHPIGSTSTGKFPRRALLTPSVYTEVASIATFCCTPTSLSCPQAPTFAEECR